MPTYEYVCAKCEHEFDVLQSIADKALTTCPKALCGLKKWGKGKVKRKISAGGGLIFKGSGFYITDYRSDSYKEAARKESGGGESSGSGEKKAGEGAAKEAKETKPAAPKAEPKPSSKKAD